MFSQYNSGNSQLFITDDTKGIELNQLTHIILSKKDLANLLHIPLKEIENSNNWYEANGVEYYIKKRALMINIINELLGEYISRYMNLPTIQYSLLLHDGKIIGLASKNFRKSGIKYIKANRLTIKEHNKINKVLLSSSNIFNHNYKKQMYDYIMRNFYTNQCDRMNNVLCYYKHNRIYLAELYDYEMSLISPEDYRIIDPYFMGMDLTTNFLSRLMKFDISMEDSLNKILNFDMNLALEYLVECFKINLPDDLKAYYVDYDEKRKKLINQKIIKK